MVPTPGIVCAVAPAVKTTGSPLPSTTPAIVKVVTVTGPSTLEVPVNRLPVLGVSSGVVTDSETSVKGSLLGIMVSVSVDVLLPPLPSLTVYVATGIAPA